jgi:hypothetical protein
MNHLVNLDPKLIFLSINLLSWFSKLLEAIKIKNKQNIETNIILNLEKYNIP